MSNYEEIDDLLAQSLIDGMQEQADSAKISLDELRELLNNLTEAIPYFTDPSMYNAHRDAVSRQLGLYLPKESISAKPYYSGGGGSYQAWYSYDGNYDDYQDAFYHSVGSNDAQQELNAQVSAAASQLNSSWWGNFSVAITTDCVNRHHSVTINGGNLNDALERFNSEFKPGLTPSYLAVFTDGYSPTCTAYRAIESTGQMSEAAQMLNDGISSNGFRTNFNAVMLNPGDDPLAAEWFLYNLWVALKALGYPDVDAAIAEHEAEGLIIHDHLLPVNWWVGAYDVWYTAVDGELMYGYCQGTMNADFPYRYCTNGTMGMVICDDGYKDPNGYCESLCEWGDLNYYFSG
ncbi:MAG: hypothetical protein AAF570_03250 [Bacteroidota bacterium]